MGHSPGSSIQKWVHFLPFIKRFGNFSMYLEATESQFFFSRLNFEIYFSHSKNFPRSKCYFGIFSKLCIVSWIFFCFDFNL